MEHLELQDKWVIRDPVIFLLWAPGEVKRWKEYWWQESKKSIQMFVGVYFLAGLTSSVAVAKYRKSFWLNHSEWSGTTSLAVVILLLKLNSEITNVH